MKNEILRSANAKNELKWIKKTCLWCIPLCFGICSAATVFFFVGGGGGGALLHINHNSKAGHFYMAGYWTSNNKNAIFSAKIQFTAMFFSPQEENLLFLSGSSAQKSLIISPSNWAICAWLQGMSGFPLVPVDIVVPTISFAFEIWNHARLTISVIHVHDGCKGLKDLLTILLTPPS